MKPQIEADVDVLNSQCSAVEKDDFTKISQCASRRDELRQNIAYYRKQLAAFKCSVAAVSTSDLRDQIARTQEALRNTGTQATADAYEQIGAMAQERRDEFIEELISSLTNVAAEELFEAVKEGILVTGSIGSAQGKRYVKLARDLGADNPDFLEAIERFSRVKSKPDAARALNDVIDQARLMGTAAYANYKAEHSQSSADFLLNYGNFLMVFVSEAAPEAANQLAKKFPRLAVGAAKQVSIGAGLAVASPIATFGHDLRLLGAMAGDLRELDTAAKTQLRAIAALQDRMKTLVSEVKAQRGAAAKCPI